MLSDMRKLLPFILIFVLMTWAHLALSVAYGKAVSLNSNADPAYLDIGLGYRHQNFEDIDKTIIGYQMVLDVDPGSVLASSALGFERKLPAIDYSFSSGRPDFSSASGRRDFV